MALLTCRIHFQAHHQALLAWEQAGQQTAVEGLLLSQREVVAVQLRSGQAVWQVAVDILEMPLHWRAMEHVEAWHG